MFKLFIFVIFLKGFCLANPFVGLFDPKCVVIRNMKCPNENVTFWLYNKQTADSPVKLDPLNLQPKDFQPRKPLFIVLHGYTGDRDYSPNRYIRPALLESQDVYVISVDYGALVPYPCYFAAVENLPLASKCLAHLINNLVDQGVVNNDDIHMIGFSLGAQVAGQTTNYLKRRLKRITGLDPAKPMFITVGSDRKLDPTDAEFVDVIHTDVLGRGMLRTMGHVDFYPNIGPYQPGCQEENMEDPGSCNHDRAPQYYAESIRSNKGFWAYSCPSWLHNIFGLCNTQSNDEIMGFHVNQSASGSFFLKTANQTPFALGPFTPSSQAQHRNLPVLYDYKDIYDDEFEPQLRKAFVDWTDNEFCPNKDIQFWLYTKETEQNPLLLDLLKLKPDSFPERLPLKILLHGLGLDHDLSPNEELRPLLLQYERVYIISVDYKNLSRVLCLTPWALQNCRIIAKCLALLITNLVEQLMYSPDDIHLIGFSLGAQIAGLSANHLNYRVKRITGLDPAGPTFDTDNINERLDPTDAQFEDIIHTDPRFLSISRAMGHADFYPNYLKLIQPGCSPIEEYRDCNHFRSNKYYAESIVTNVGFWSYNCGSYMEYLYNQCANYSGIPHALMGYYVDESARGSYFLETNSNSPYAQGPLVQVELQVADSIAKDAIK
ncbi:hypothetical protein FF38_09439 [Lucilia cuprina]|uniref:Lipase domain-containing protein n=1 Tax=Lucilia cuprina TaxID=7375 RepID=A0A0L0C8C6_LUCCU|nr:hypothetical protein FF38_09439 [Lucilia cuprina]